MLLQGKWHSKYKMEGMYIWHMNLPSKHNFYRRFLSRKIMFLQNIERSETRRQIIFKINEETDRIHTAILPTLSYTISNFCIRIK